MSGLWTPAHCGIPGNERADLLAKAGSQMPQGCPHSHTAKAWLQAQVRRQLKTDWKTLFPPDPASPLPPSTTSPRELRGLSPASTRALFRLQSGTTPSDPFPNKEAENCICGGLRTAQQLLLECPLLAEARNDLLPLVIPMTDPNRPAPLSLSPSDIRFDVAQIPALTTFLRRTSLGFIRDVRDRLAKDDPEVGDLDVGPIGRLSLDIDI